MKSKDLDGPASHKTGEFKSAWLIHEQEEEAAHKAMMEAYERPYKPVQDSLLNDWTGHRYGKYWATYGEETPIPPVAEVLDDNGYSLGKRVFKEKNDEAEIKSVEEVKPENDEEKESSEKDEALV